MVEFAGALVPEDGDDNNAKNKGTGVTACLDGLIASMHTITADTSEQIKVLEKAVEMEKRMQKAAKAFPEPQRVMVENLIDDIRKTITRLRESDGSLSSRFVVIPCGWVRPLPGPACAAPLPVPPAPLPAWFAASATHIAHCATS